MSVGFFTHLVIMKVINHQCCHGTDAMARLGPSIHLCDGRVLLASKHPSPGLDPMSSRDQVLGDAEKETAQLCQKKAEMSKMLSQ